MRTPYKSLFEAKSEEERANDLLDRYADADMDGREIYQVLLNNEISLKLAKEMAIDVRPDDAKDIKSQFVSSIYYRLIRKFGAKDKSESGKYILQFSTEEGYKKARKFITKNEVKVNNYDSINKIIQLDIEK